MTKNPSIDSLKINLCDSKVSSVIFSNSSVDLDKKSNEAAKQLREYFAGKRKDFSLPLELKGTDFQKKVWRALQKIPYGKTVTYSDIAKSIGKPKAVRAVGQAINRNPISIIIPCHRVIGKDGSLTGYAGGLWRKEWLLKHEQRLL